MSSPSEDSFSSEEKRAIRWWSKEGICEPHSYTGLAYVPQTWKKTTCLNHLWEKCRHLRDHQGPLKVEKHRSTFSISTDGLHSKSINHYWDHQIYDEFSLYLESWIINLAINFNHRYKHMPSSSVTIFAAFMAAQCLLSWAEGCGPQVISGDSVEILIRACPLSSSSTVRFGIYFPPILSPRSNLNPSLVVLEKYVIEYCRSRYSNASDSYWYFTMGNLHTFWQLFAPPGAIICLLLWKL